MVMDIFISCEMVNVMLNTYNNGVRHIKFMCCKNDENNGKLCSKYKPE